MSDNDDEQSNVENDSYSEDDDLFDDGLDSFNDIEDQSIESSSINSVKTIPGLVYISNLPPKMTPLYIRQIFSKYGEVGRVYLQPDGM